MSERNARNFLVIRLSSLGDIVHTVPAVAALRQAFPGARIDWIVEQKWSPLVRMVTGVDHVIPLERSWRGNLSAIATLRRVRYDCAVDFQGLYKSALLAWFSGATRRIGRDRSAAREPGAAMFYNDPVIPQGKHVAEMSLSLAARAALQDSGQDSGQDNGEGNGQAGAQSSAITFPLRVPEPEARALNEKLLREGFADYMLVSPGGGWKSKCWPPERYGSLCAELWRRHGLRSIVNVGPGEDELGEAVIRAATYTATDAIADPTLLGTNAVPVPLLLRPSLPELAALSARARLVVAADTGPLHLAAALGTPVVALFGPTSPDRNGPLPYGRVIRGGQTSGASSGAAGNYQRGDYARGTAYSPEMLSLTVEQVLADCERELGVLQ